MSAILGKDEDRLVCDRLAFAPALVGLKCLDDSSNEFGARGRWRIVKRAIFPSHGVNPTTGLSPPQITEAVYQPA